MVTDISNTVDGNSSDSFETVFASIKNLMSDRCKVQNKFNVLFTEFRSSILPDKISTWNDLSLDEQQKLKTINDFYYGLHFIVVLGNQTEACLKVWESLLVDDIHKVGSLAHGGYSNGESGTLRLVRTVC